jgi:hypothetical protein
MEKSDFIYDPNPYATYFNTYDKEENEFTCRSKIHNHWNPTTAKDIIKFSSLPKNVKFDIEKKIKENNNIEEKKEKEKENNIEEENAQFWNLIDNLHWYDKDDGKMDIISLHNIRENHSFIFGKLETYFIPKLKIDLNNLHVRDILNESDYNNFISHIVFKGTQFYNAVTESPDLCMYLLYNYHPIYNWLATNPE